MGERIMLPAGTHLFKEVCVLAFFTVVASYSNLSTFFSGAKVVQINRMCNSLMFFLLFRRSYSVNRWNSIVASAERIRQMRCSGVAAKRAVE